MHFTSFRNEQMCSDQVRGGEKVFTARRNFLSVSKFVTHLSPGSVAAHRIDRAPDKTGYVG